MSRTKLKKFEQLKLMKHVIQPSREELLSDNFHLKGRWRTQFNNDNPIILELGCGKGEYTVSLAEMNSDFNYIGIDIKGSRIYSGAAIVAQKNMNNVLFIMTQVEHLLSLFSSN